MNPGASVFDYWRPFQPVAPELETEARSGIPLLVDIGDQYRIQGARTEEGLSPDDPSYSKVPAERGWRVRPLIVSEPLHGTVTIDDNGEMIYTSVGGYEGPDCFNYVLTNGFQQSATSKVMIMVNRYYELWIILHHYDASGNNFIITTKTVEHSNLPKIQFKDLSLRYTAKEAHTDDAGVVRIRDSVVWSSATNYDRGYYNVGRAFAPSYVFYPYQVVLRSRSDMNLPPGFDGDSQIVYEPQDFRGDVEISLKLYTKTEYNKYKFWYSGPHGSYYVWRDIHQVDLDSYIELKLNLSDVYGERWWESGNIQPVGSHGNYQ